MHTVSEQWEKQDGGLVSETFLQEGRLARRADWSGAMCVVLPSAH